MLNKTILILFNGSILLQKLFTTGNLLGFNLFLRFRTIIHVFPLVVGIWWNVNVVLLIALTDIFLIEVVNNEWLCLLLNNFNEHFNQDNTVVSCTSICFLLIYFNFFTQMIFLNRSRQLLINLSFFPIYQ